MPAKEGFSEVFFIMWGPDGKRDLTRAFGRQSQQTAHTAVAVTLFTMSQKGGGKLERNVLIIENTIPNNKSETCPAPNPLTRSRRAMSSPGEGIFNSEK